MVGKSTVVRDIALKQIMPDIKNMVSSATNFAQGDILIFDTVSKLVRAPTAEAEGQYLLGIAALDVASGKPLSPYQGTAVDSAQAIPSLNGPLYGATFNMILKTGDSLSPGDLVYVYTTAGTSGVASTGTKAIGMYEGAAIVSAAASTVVEVLIGARFPNDVLKF